MAGVSSLYMNVYNSYMTSYNTKSLTRYDTHKKSELKSIYNAIVKLNTEGIDGLESFQVQAKNAVGGIKTQITNMKTAITRGVANIIDGLDKGLKNANIEGGIGGLIGKIGEGFEKGLSGIGKYIEKTLPKLLSGEMSFKDFGKDITSKLLDGVKTGMENLKNAIPEVLPKVVEENISLPSDVYYDLNQNCILIKENLNEKIYQQPVYKPFDVQHPPCSAKSVGRKQHEIRHGIYADSGAYMRHFNVFIRQFRRCKP